MQQYSDLAQFTVKMTIWHQEFKDNSPFFGIVLC